MSIEWDDANRPREEVQELAKNIELARGVVRHSSRKQYGIRTLTNAITEARQVLNPNLMRGRSNVVGSYRYDIKGFTSQISGPCLMTGLEQENAEAGWTGWSVLPLTCYMTKGLTGWLVTADGPPPKPELLTSTGRLIITPAMMASERKAQNLPQNLTQQGPPTKYKTGGGDAEDPLMKHDPWGASSGGYKATQNLEEPRYQHQIDELRSEMKIIKDNVRATEATLTKRIEQTDEKLTNTISENQKALRKAIRELSSNIRVKDQPSPVRRRRRRDEAHNSDDDLMENEPSLGAGSDKG
jgi:hypothetical protein